MATSQEPHSVSMSSKNQGMMRTPLGEFQIGKTLGEGSYGKVKLIINVKTNEKVTAPAARTNIPVGRQDNQEVRPARPGDGE